MNLNEYFGFPEGTNAQMRYSNFYDMVDSNFPCQSDMTNIFSDETKRTCLKQINITNDTTNLNYMFSNCENLEYFEGIENWNVSNVTNMSNMFSNCKKLEYIEGIENWNTSNVTNMSNMFDYSNNMKNIYLPNWNVSNVTNMSDMFKTCSSLTDLSFISNWDTSKVTDMSSMFVTCGSLETLGSIRCDSVTFSNYAGMFGSTSNLVNFGGLINLKSQLIYRYYSLNQCPNLSYESCINVLNGLYDFTANNEVPTSTQGKLLVHQNFLDKVGEEISIATNKGWNVYA